MISILIVDNSSVILNVLSDLFAKGNNFKIKTAKSFEEASSLIDKNEFFLCITNFVLSDALNGELIDFLNSRYIPTIVLTSSADNIELEKVKNQNVIDYVIKNSINDLEIICNLVELIPFIKNKKVLVVTSSLELSLKISKILKSLLLEVVIKKDSDTAIEYLKKDNDISMMIFDYDIIPLNALDLIIELRKNEKNAHTPIITLTESSDELKAKLYKNGTNDVLNKPILDVELKSKILQNFNEKKRVHEIKTFNKIFDENVISSSSDLKGNIKNVSIAFCNISGYTREEMIGQPHSLLRHPSMKSEVYKDLWKTIKSGNVWEGEIKNLKKDGNFYWVRAVISPNFDNEENIIGYTSVREDITNEKLIYELSITDGLTSLYNRRHFNDIANSLINETLRENNIFAFALLDIDNFKMYNDTYGHQEGDNVLISFSKVLKETFKRSNDLVFRLGGEEFGILIGAASEQDIKILLESSCTNIRNLQIQHLKNLPSKIVTASFGVTIISEMKKDIILDDIYKNADLALYEAKDQGRDQIKYFS